MEGTRDAVLVVPTEGVADERRGNVGRVVEGLLAYFRRGGIVDSLWLRSWLDRNALANGRLRGRGAWRCG